MFKNVEARYALRCVLAGIYAAVAVLGTGGDWKEIVVAGVGAALAAAGIGAAIPAVEPHIGKKLAP